MNHHKSTTSGAVPASVPMRKPESAIEKIIQWFIYAMLIVTVAMAAISFFSKRTDQEAAIGSFDSDTLDTGWVLEQNGESRSITLPMTVNAKADEILILRNTLPEKLSDGSSLMIRAAMEDVYVYINGELREQYASENFENMSYYIPSAYVVVGLSETDAKAEIEIHFRVKTRGRLNAITLGYGNNVWFDVIRKSLPVDVVAFLVLVLGVIVVIVSQAVKHITENARASFSLGLLMIDMAIWVISESNLRQIIFSQPSMAQYYAYFSVEMIVLLAARYFDEVQHRQYHRRTMIVEILIAGQLAINILLKITGVMELYRSLTFSHIWMALGFLVGVVGIVQDIREKRITQYRATALGMLGFLLMAMMELVTFYVSRFHTFGIFVCIGLVILMIATLIQAVLDQVNAAQERECKQSKMIVNTIEIIAGAIDAKDAYTGGHSERVGRYAEILARGMAQEYHFTEQDITRIRYIGVMHDIGKISMADNVLNKAGRLTDEEFSFMKKYVDIGAVLMESMDESVEGLIDGIRYHHERYDGGGYPEGLSGTDIPLIARIICLADCYDVMTSNRVYRKRLADQKVREEFIRCAGTQFDPALTKIFVELMDKGELHPYTVNGMAMSENGEALKSEQLDDYLQHIALSEAGVANYLTHVRMLCYLMKLKEKKGERVDVFIVKLAGSETAQKNENTNGSRLEDIINSYLKKQDINIEYNDHIRIVAMFNRKDEEIDRFAEALMETPLQLEMERF